MILRRPALNIAVGHLLRGLIGGVSLATQNSMGAVAAACSTLSDEITGWMRVEHKKLGDMCECQACIAEREQKRVVEAASKAN